MNEIYAAAKEVQTFFDSHGWPNCIIGALAVIRWGRRFQPADGVG